MKQQKEKREERDGGFIIFRGKTSITLIQYCMAQIKRTRSTELNKIFGEPERKVFVRKSHCQDSQEI